MDGRRMPDRPRSDPVAKVGLAAGGLAVACCLIPTLVGLGVAGLAFGLGLGVFVAVAIALAVVSLMRRQGNSGCEVDGGEPSASS
jgi:uncharacterized membrane protein